jgi:hypothetical protein
MVWAQLVMVGIDGGDRVELMETTATDTRELLADLEARLRPRVVREQVISSLEELFASGIVPDPPLDGFHAGRAITSTLAGGLDSLGRSLGDLYMPWLGKRFQPETGGGVNVLRASARLPLKTMWPRYEPESNEGEHLDAFRFKTRIAPGAVDKDLEVLKIDYDFQANPTFIVRSILDELVQIEEGLYLGKVLYRRDSRFQRIGFFVLER